MKEKLGANGVNWAKCQIKRFHSHFPSNNIRFCWIDGLRIGLTSQWPSLESQVYLQFLNQNVTDIRNWTNWKTNKRKKHPRGFHQTLIRIRHKKKQRYIFVLTKLINITLRGLLGFEDMKYEKIYVSFVRHVLFCLL